MSNRPPDDPKEHVAIPLPPELLARAEALLPQFSTPSHQATIGEVLRAALFKGIELQEAEDAQKKEAPPS